VAALQGLQVTNASPLTKGVPKVIFICEAHLPDYFVAESVSVWGTMAGMSAWTLQARLRRFTAAERNPPSTILTITRQFHIDVVTEYNATGGHPPFNPPFPNDDGLHGLTHAQRAIMVAARRQSVIQNVANPAMWYDHSTHRAIPLRASPPTFPPRHRCYKCRAIYDYNIQNLAGAGPTEGAGNLYYLDGNFPALSCAEVLCHCFCTRADNAVEEQKTKKQRLEKPDPSSGGGGSRTIFGGGSTRSTSGGLGAGFVGGGILVS
jgi:hypothetical protein